LGRDFDLDELSVRKWQPGSAQVKDLVAPIEQLMRSASASGKTPSHKPRATTRHLLAPTEENLVAANRQKVEQRWFHPQQQFVARQPTESIVLAILLTPLLVTSLSIQAFAGLFALRRD
jgi:hypothetical protein